MAKKEQVCGSSTGYAVNTFVIRINARNFTIASNGEQLLYHTLSGSKGQQEASTYYVSIFVLFCFSVRPFWFYKVTIGCIHQCIQVMSPHHLRIIDLTIYLRRTSRSSLPPWSIALLCALLDTRTEKCSHQSEKRFPKMRIAKTSGHIYKSVTQIRCWTSESDSKLSELWECVAVRPNWRFIRAWNKLLRRTHFDWAHISSDLHQTPLSLVTHASAASEID